MANTVLVAFSGGVDSAMTALLLREQGHDVVAAFMSVRGDGPGEGCGAKEDGVAARRLADGLGLPFIAVDCADAYRRLVLDYFRSEYLAGRTPNPCVRCNPLIKFRLLPELAARAGFGFDLFATGHYARIEYRPGLGRHVLSRGVDPSKDQSYFLYRLEAEQLARTMFPLGGMTKKAVRALAAERGLAVHDKPDSQDFQDGGYAGLMRRDPLEGDIVDLDGKTLGRHQGYWNFTPGQRKGLGVAFREPLYVVMVEPERNRVLVGTKAEALSGGCRVADTHFLLPEPAEGARLRGRLRSSQPLRGMTVGKTDADNGLIIRFDEPLQGVAPGQSLVLYDGDDVVGGGIIEARL